MKPKVLVPKGFYEEAVELIRGVAEKLHLFVTEVAIVGYNEFPHRLVPLVRFPSAIRIEYMKLGDI